MLKNYEYVNSNVDLDLVSAPTEKWVQCLDDSIKTSEYIAYFYQGQFDSRGRMNDCVRPSWSRNGEYKVRIVPIGNKNPLDDSGVLQIVVLKDEANKIWWNIKHKNISKDTCRKYFKELESSGKGDEFYEGK